jgi:hypothetical protein
LVPATTATTVPVPVASRLCVDYFFSFGDILAFTELISRDLECGAER